MNEQQEQQQQQSYIMEQQQHCALSDLEDVVDSIQAMRRQEEDYQYNNRCLYARHLSQGFESNIDFDLHDCRYKMARWCYRVVDTCNFSRETVQHAMSILDRSSLHFFSSSSSSSSWDKRLPSRKRQYQLLAMTSLYTSIKIFETRAVIHPSTLVTQFSPSGYFTVENVERMEMELLLSLGFRINKPTPMAFVHTFLSLLPTMTKIPVTTMYHSHDEEEEQSPSMNELMKLVKLQIEESLCYPELMHYSASTIALASLSNAFHYCWTSYNHEDERFHHHQQQQQFLHFIATVAHLNHVVDTLEYKILQEKLHGIIVTNAVDSSSFFTFSYSTARATTIQAASSHDQRSNEATITMSSPSKRHKRFKMDNDSLLVESSSSSPRVVTFSAV